MYFCDCQIYVSVIRSQISIRQYTKCSLIVSFQAQNSVIHQTLRQKASDYFMTRLADTLIRSSDRILIYHRHTVRICVALRRQQPPPTRRPTRPPSTYDRFTNRRTIQTIDTLSHLSTHVTNASIGIFQAQNVDTTRLFHRLSVDQNVDTVFSSRRHTVEHVDQM